MSETKKKRKASDSGLILPKIASIPVTQARSVYASFIEDNYGSSSDMRMSMLPQSVCIKPGIPIPFVLQYVLSYGVLPLGGVIEINGPPQSFKTAMSYEIGKRFIQYGGALNFLVTEAKISEDYAHSIMGYNHKTLNNFHPVLTKTMNKWQKLLLQFISLGKDVVDKGDDVNKIPAGGFVPYLFAIDSVMGANLEEVDGRIVKKGFADRDMPVMAQSLTNFLKLAANSIEGYPFMLLLINHRKEQKSEQDGPYAPKVFTKAGGQHLRFQATYELVLRCVGKWTTQDMSGKGSMDVEWRRIRIENGKNSAGTDGRFVDVDVSWRNRIVDGQLRQITTFHWDKAIVDLLMDWQEAKLVRGANSDKGVKGRKENMDRHFHIRKIPRVGYISDTLGIDKSNALSAEQMGRAISSNPEIIKKLQFAFGIPAGMIWQPYTSYRDTLKYANAIAKEEADRLLNSKETETDILDDDFYDRASEFDVYAGMDPTQYRRLEPGLLGYTAPEVLSDE